MYRILTLTLLSTVVIISTAVASPESHRQAVEEMLAISRVDQMLEPMMDNVMTVMQQQMSQVNIPEDKKPIVDKYNQKIIETLRHEMRWENMQEDFVALYLEVYSEDEIRGLTDFYKTPLGQKMLDKMPELMQASMQISQGLLQQTLPKIQQLSQEMALEIQGTE